MRLLPLVLSAHVSAYSPWAGFGAESACGVGGSCRFCGLAVQSWQDPYHLSGDHADNSKANVVAACVLCHLAQHLGRPAIEEEAVLVWLPEMTQGALNACVRRIHQLLLADGQSLDVTRRVVRRGGVGGGALSLYRALHARSWEAQHRLDTVSPRILGHALLRLSADEYARRSVHLGGVRLFPLGKYYRKGRNIYPALVRELDEAAKAAST